MKLSAFALAVVLAGGGAAFAQAPPAQIPPAQTPPAGAPTPLKPAVATPNYVVIPMDIDVNRPAAAVWKRVGKYCDIAEWLPVAAGCRMLSGTEGEVGSVRSVGNEVLIARTELSYGYTQPVYEGRPYNLYHGYLEARPLTATTTKVLYTLIYDNSLVPGDATAKAAEIQARRTRFERALRNIKILAEGGTLPPLPPPAPQR